MAGLLALAAIPCFGCNRQRVRLASDAEIRAVVPQELLVQVPVDSEARARYEELVAVVKSLKEEDANLIDYPDQVINDRSRRNASRAKVAKIAGSSLKDEEAAQYGLAKWVLSTHPRLIPNVSDLLAAGPLQVPVDKPFKSLSDDDFAIMRFVRAITRCAEWFEFFGDYKASTELVCLSINLTDRLFSDQGPLGEYLLAVIDEGIVDFAVVDMASDPAYPVDNCKFLLAAMMPAPKIDEFAVECILVDFQSDTLRRLLNPLKLDDPSVVLSPEDKAGTFDAIETAKMSGEAAVAAIVNVRKTMPAFDASSVRRIDQKTKDLPQPLPRYSGAVAKQAYCNRMNDIDNSIGLSILQGFHTLGMLPSISCRWRAMHDAAGALGHTPLQINPWRQPAGFDGRTRTLSRRVATRPLQPQANDLCAR